MKSVLVAAAIGAVLLLAVPYFIPTRKVLSDSYCMGFNNRAAVLLWLAFCIGFAWWRGPVRPSVSSPLSRRSQTHWPLLAALGAALLLHVAAWALQARFGAMQEARYFLDRLQHLAAGEHIYRDFEFAYGAGLLYVPLWLSRVLHLSLLSAYSLAMLLEQAAGLLCLWYVTQTLGVRSAHRNAIFLLTTGTMLAWVVLFPAQYTSFRFCLVPAIAVFAFQTAVVRKRRVVPLFVLVVGFGLTLLVSPEQTVGLLGGTVLFGALFLRAQWKWVFPGLLVFALACALMLYAALRLRALDTLMQMGKGGYAIPIGPMLCLLPVLGLLLVASCTLVEGIRSRSEARASFYLLCISPFFLTAAFGRCESVHLLSNTLTATLVAWFVLAENERYWRWAFRTYVAIIFIFPMQLVQVYWSEFKLVRKEWRHAPVAVANASGDLPTFYSPLGLSQPVHPGDALPFRLNTGRYYGTTDLISTEQVQEKVAELRAQGDAPIVAGYWGCDWAPSRTPLMLAMQSPFYRKARRHVDTLESICHELSEHYVRVADPGIELPPQLGMYRRLR